MIRLAWWSTKRAALDVVRSVLTARPRLAARRRFWRSYRAFDLVAPPEWRIEPAHLFPRIGEDTGETPIEPTYFYQDAWAFEHVVATRPPFHVDVGSHHKYVALLSRVLPVTMVDIRPLSLPLDGLRFTRGSIVALPYADASVPSLSSLCVIEHVGLGRYGDPIDPLGHERAVGELKRVVAPGGDLYVSVPVRDGNRVYFNAHRAFDEAYFLSLLAPLDLVDRAYVLGSAFVRARPPGTEAVGCYRLRRRP